jgi:4-carboxymuconolactone decarboxylase
VNRNESRTDNPKFSIGPARNRGLQPTGRWLSSVSSGKTDLRDAFLNKLSGRSSMSRMPDVTRESLSEEQRAVFDQIASGPHARVIGPFPAWLQSPELARRARALSEFLRFQSSPPKRLAEIAILVTGRHWGAEFEFYAHAELARKAGVGEPIIQAIAAGKRPAFSEPTDEIVYDLCTEMFASRRISDATYRRAVDAFGLKTLVELIAIMGYYCMVSVTLNAFEAPLPPGEPSPFPDGEI